MTLSGFSTRNKTIVGICELFMLLVIFSQSINIPYDLADTAKSPLAYFFYGFIIFEWLLFPIAALASFSQRKGLGYVFGFIAFFVCGILYTKLRFPQNMEYLRPLYLSFLQYVVVAKLVFSDYIRVDILIKKAIVASRFISVALLIVFLVLFPQDNYMTFSDAISMSAAILVYSGFQVNKLDLIGGFLVLLSIVIFGGRGALLSLIILIILLAFFIDRNKKKKMHYVLISIFVLPLLLLLLLSVVDFSDSRTVQMLVSGDGSYDSSRSLIWEVLFLELFSNPIAGIGMRGDTYILPNYFKDESNVAYAHNIFIELFCDFGIVVGGIIALFLLYILIKGLILNYKVNPKIKGFIYVFFCVSFIQLLSSRTYLMENNFYVLIFFVIEIYFSKGKDVFETNSAKTKFSQFNQRNVFAKN